MTAHWDEYNVTDIIREILRSLPPNEKYGRPFLTSYQIAIAIACRFPQIAASLGHPTGGEGHGPYALTNYIARWLPDRIQRGAADIEMRLLAPDHLNAIQFNDRGTTITATTNQAGFNSTMFRAVGP